MAITQNTFTGDGSNLGPFTFTFKWLESTDIKVTVNGALKTAGTHYNLQSLNYTTRSGGQVLFTTGNAPASSAAIVIYRDTDDTDLAATFYSGSAIRSQDLNDNFLQNLYIAQETNNNVAGAVAGQIPDESIGTSKLVDQSVTAAKIADGVTSSKFSFLQSGTGAVSRTVENKLKDVVSVKDFGAVGDGVTNDTTAIQTATATGQPIYVPQSSSFYSITALTSTQQSLLYGPGIIKISGNQIQISSTPFINTDTAHVRVYNQNLQPSKWPTVDGSLFNGSVSVSAKRTGGFGSYGLNLTEYVVSDSLPAGEFDVGVTSWVTTQNLTGGQAFGMWCGANSPSSSLSQTFTGGAVIGQEINVGNRWSDLGLINDIGAPYYTVGQLVVPDVLPAPDGSTAAIYPGSFGQVIAKSINGHKWWTGILFSSDAIVPGGRMINAIGGSTALNSTGAIFRATNYFTRGLDFSGATFSDHAILFGSSQRISWGGASMNGSSTTLGITTGGTGEGGIYGNNYSQLVIRWNSSGSAPQLGFFGAAVVGKPTVTGSKGGNLALGSLVTALSNLGLITDSTT